MPFFEFIQNNSGGSFVQNETLCHIVIIEAGGLNEALDKAEDLGCYFDGVSKGIDCPCCGDRWYPPYSSDGMEFPYVDGKDTYETIEDYASEMAEIYTRWSSSNVRVFKRDGSVLEY